MHCFMCNATVLIFMLKGRHLGIDTKPFGASNSFEYTLVACFFGFSLSLLPPERGLGGGDGGTTGEGQSVITRKQSREISGRPQQ